MISYGTYGGAAGARRPKAGHGDILTYYFSILQPILAGLPFNNTAKTWNAFFKLRQKASPNFVNLENRINIIFSTNFLDDQLHQTSSTINFIFSTSSTRKLDHRHHLLDNFDKLSRQLRENFCDHRQTFSTNSDKLSRHHRQTFSTSSSNFLDNFDKLSRHHRQTFSTSVPRLLHFFPLFSDTTTLLFWNTVFRYLIFCLSIPFFHLEFRG